MKIARVETLISRGSFANSTEWCEIRSVLHQSITAVVWTPGNAFFADHPQGDNKLREGNGIKHIEKQCMERLRSVGWTDERPLPFVPQLACRDMYAIFQATSGTVAMKLGVGSNSSSHHVLNTMAIGLMQGSLISASLVIPSSDLSKSLANGIGSFHEIEPYLDFWRTIPCQDGVFEIIVIEQAPKSPTTLRISKESDGRVNA